MAAAKKPVGKAAAEKGTKRVLTIERRPNSALFFLRFIGGGQMPEYLEDASFTSLTLAEKAIEDYKAGK